MEKLEVKLFDTKLENVFNFLFSQFQSPHWQEQRTRVIAKDDYPDAITDAWQSKDFSPNIIEKDDYPAVNDYPDVIETIIHNVQLMQPNWDNNKFIVKERHFIAVFPGSLAEFSQAVYGAAFRHSANKGNADYDSLAQRIFAKIFQRKSLPARANKNYYNSLDWRTTKIFPGNAAEKVQPYTLDGLIFTGHQLQTDTVQIQFEYSEIWQELANRILSELRESFPEPLDNRAIAEGQALLGKELHEARMLRRMDAQLRPHGLTVFPDSQPKVVPIVGANSGTTLINASREQAPNLIRDIVKAYNLSTTDFPFGQAEMAQADLTALPKIEDPTDQRIWGWIKENLSITDMELAQKLGVTRQAVNSRRRSLEKMGYKVRVSRQK